ncbi:MAG: IPT/TIG domain-containing protein [Verrucomicrobiota bacterium]
MKTRRTLCQRRAGWILTSLLLLFSLSSHAMNYTNREMLLCFRELTGGTDMEVNLGDAPNFNGLTPGFVWTITNYSQASLSNAYGGDYTTLTWAVFAAVNTNITMAYPEHTIWVTKPRTNTLLETIPWPRGSAVGAAANTTLMMDSVGVNGNLYSIYTMKPDPVLNNATTVLIPSSNPESYTSVQIRNANGSTGNFGQYWPGDVENTTPGESAPFPWVSRSDLFFVLPGSGPSAFLGYFEFKDDGTNGTMTFHASDGAAPGLSKISAGTGPTNGGTSLTLTGTNFYNDTNLVVEFGGVPATMVVFNNGDSVTATAPPNGAGTVNVTVINSDGQSATLANAFTYEGAAGPVASLEVMISPPAAVSAGAMWQLDNNGQWQTNGAVLSGLDVTSNHTVAFSVVAGWTTPASQTVSVTNGTTNVATGNYAQQFGSVEVTILPSNAVAAGAMWEVDGNGAWQTNGAVVSGLAVVSNHTVSFSTVAGFATPGSQLVSVTNGMTNMVTGDYLPPSGALEVTILPAQVVAAGATWEVDNNGQWQTSGAVVAGLNVTSNHTVAFLNVSGWFTPANQSVAVTNGTTNLVTATYVQQTGSLEVTMQPPAAVAAGAMWQVDGGPWQTNEAVASGLATVTTHTVAFTNLPGWATPANLTVSITNGMTNLVTGTYAQELGSLEVTITPAAAVTAGAAWQVDGMGYTNSGATVANLSAGNHTVSFNAVSDWDTPANQTVAISNGVTSQATGVYTLVKIGKPSLAISAPKSGESVSNEPFEIKGTVKDDVAVAAVYYKLNTGDWMPATPENAWSNWPASLSNLNAGANTLSAYVVDNSGKAATNKAFTFKYIPSAVLDLKTNGIGTVTPNDGGKWLELGTKYTLKAAPLANNLYIFSNWVASGSTNFTSNSPAVSFTMQSNLVLTANFAPNPFLAEQGTFSGLFMNTNSSDVTEAGSGFFTLALTSKGAFTGKITLPGGPYSFSSNFDAGGQVQFTIPKAKPEALTVNLQLDISEPTNEQITGTISNAAWTAWLTADRAVFNATTTKAANYEGQYTLAIPGNTNGVGSPGGYGWGALTISSAGAISMNGSLADGTAISQSSVSVSKDGHWPFYAAYKNPPTTEVGAVFGWVNLSNLPASRLGGDLYWLRPEGATPKAYPGGFTNLSVPVIGSRFSLASDAPALVLTNGEAILEGGGLSTNLTNSVSISSKNALEAAAGANALSLKLTTSGAKAGEISGGFDFPASGKKADTTISGVVLQEQNEAVGYFLRTNQSGSFQLQNSP